MEKKRLYRITADYRPNNPKKPTYYVVGYSKQEAKKKFQDRISWLKIYDIEEILEGEVIAEVMLNPARYIIIE